MLLLLAQCKIDQSAFIRHLLYSCVNFFTVITQHFLTSLIFTLVTHSRPNYCTKNQHLAVQCKNGNPWETSCKFHKPKNHHFFIGQLFSLQVFKYELLFSLYKWHHYKILSCIWHRITQIHLWLAALASHVTMSCDLSQTCYFGPWSWPNICDFYFFAIFSST